jgi:hypothetical protein
MTAATTADVLVALARRRRRQLGLFLLGLVIIVVPGLLWAGFTKDPIRGSGLNGGFVDGPFFEGQIFVDDVGGVVETTVVLEAPAEPQP